MFNIFTSINQDFINKIFNQTLKLEDGTFQQGQKIGNIIRDSKVCWIHDMDLRKEALYATNFIMRKNDFFFNLDTIEPLQYTEYEKDGQYGWHQDTFKPKGNYSKLWQGRIRKISFSIFLNDDFTGGEFDLEYQGPECKKRYKTFKKQGHNNIVFFPSYLYHRVRPVQSGVRKSLVGWILGPP